MMQRFVYSILFILMLQAGSVWGQTVSVPDTNLLNFLKTNYPLVIDSNDELIIANAASMTGTLDCSNLDIVNPEGLQYFTGITKLDLDDNMLTDVSIIQSMSALKTLRLENNYLTSLPSFDNLVNLQVFVAYDNQLTSLPDLSNNTQLTQIVVYNNQLTALPDLTALSNLQKLDAGNNKISVTPDVSSNTALTDLMIDRNLLTTAPDLTNLTNLTQLQLHLNNFTFEDLLPYTSHPDFSIFELFPQKAVTVSIQSLLSNGTLILSTSTDTTITGITYSWYFNAMFIGSVNDDSLVISPVSSSNEGSYQCILTHPSFPSYQITTSIINVDIVDCPTTSDFSFDYGKIDCHNEGTLKVNLSTPPQPFTYKLFSPATGDTLVSYNGVFEHLNQPEYRLRIESGPCTVIYPTALTIPTEKCKEVFITPDGDGQKDIHYFTNTGSITIFDKNGNIVKTFNAPGEWEGYDNNGSLVPPGYYYVDINNGSDFLNITVIY